MKTPPCARRASTVLMVVAGLLATPAIVNVALISLGIALRRS
jgi:hypothetical protein